MELQPAPALDLIEAANAGDADAVTRLLQSGADANCSNKSGATPLHRAAYQNHLAVAEALVAAGADVGRKDRSFGSTPLHAAAVGGAVDVMEFLLERGADWHSLNTAGRTPLALAEEMAKVEAVAVLERVARDEEERQAHHKKLCLAMMVAVKQAQPEEVSRLLQEGADANWEPLRGRTALVEAAERNHVAVMQVLVAAKAELDRADATGSTALMVAANYGSAAAAQFLLREGADDSRTDDFGRTALAIAKDHTKAEVVSTLQLWAAGRIDRDSPLPMGRGPVPHGRTHQRWASQVRDLPAGFMIEDGRLPSDVGPPLRSSPSPSAGQHARIRDRAGVAQTATLAQRSSLEHAYAPSVWDAGGAAGLLVATALELCDTESDTTQSRGTQSREAQSREAPQSRGSVTWDLEPQREG